MSTLTVSFMGPIQRPPSTVDRQRAVDQSATVDQLLTALGYPRAQHRFIRVAHGQTLLRLHQQLPPAGTLVLSVPMGGG